MHPEMYAAAVAAVLSDYPRDIIERVTDPRTGLPRTLKWLPSVAEVAEACDAAVAIRDAIAGREETMRAAEQRHAASEELYRRRKAGLDAKLAARAAESPVPAAPAITADGEGRAVATIAAEVVRDVSATPADTGPDAAAFWAAYPAGDWSARQRKAAAAAWAAASPSDRTRMIAVLPDLVRRLQGSSRPPPKPALWIISRQWAEPAAADASGRVWVAEDSPEGRTWAALDRLLIGLGEVRWCDSRRRRGAWRPSALPAIIGAEVGEVSTDRWVLIGEGTPEFAAWWGRLGELAQAIGARRVPPRPHIGRDPDTGELRRATGIDVPTRWPPPRPPAPQTATPAAE